MSIFNTFACFDFNRTAMLYPFSAYTDATGLHWYRQVLTLAFT
jgi:hypothetical protein